MSKRSYAYLLQEAKSIQELERGFCDSVGATSVALSSRDYIVYYLWRNDNGYSEMDDFANISKIKEIKDPDLKACLMRAVYNTESSREDPEVYAIYRSKTEYPSNIKLDVFDINDLIDDDLDPTYRRDHWEVWAFGVSMDTPDGVLNNLSLIITFFEEDERERTERLIREIEKHIIRE